MKILGTSLGHDSNLALIAKKMKAKRTSLSISVRRHFVDNFFFSHEDLFTSGTNILDIGGKKENKRGLFDISRYGVEVKYVNIDQSTNPDIISDASTIPIPDNSYDLILMGELLEHVPNPLVVLREAYRLLRSGGILLATVPFMYPVHADPYDFGRYTDYFWQDAAAKTGFKNVKVERQGTLFAVMALAVQHLFLAKKRSLRPIQTPLVSFLMWLDKHTKTPALQAWTTGYGLTLYKIQMTDIKQEEIKKFLKEATWYHTIDFPQGSSAGVYDHHSFIPLYKLPENLAGQEVLDVGCADGFFSFEMERRGAKRVLALDTNKGDGTIGSSFSLSHEAGIKEKYLTRQSQNNQFLNLARELGLSQAHPLHVARKLLNSKVEYKDYSIYELTGLNQTFDLVFCGDLIEHLKNPIEAVEQLAQATKKLCVITLSSLSAAKPSPRWLWLLNLNPFFRDRVVTYWGDRGGTFFHFTPMAFMRLAKASGFSKVEIVSRFDLRNHKTGLDVHHVVYHCWK